MKIEIPKYSERVGAVIFHEAQKIYELDSGLQIDEAFVSPFHVIQQIPYEKLSEIEKDMAIVIPMRNERLRLLEGILAGIPQACTPLIVSNSTRDPIDRFSLECQTVDNFCRYAKKQYLIVHQRDPEIAKLFETGGYPELLNEEGIIRNGKSEGMIVGILLARLMGKKYVGFVDADNYFPGAILEYIRIYAAGFSQAASPYSMVRIQWHSKPKIEGSGLFFAKWGRVSRVTNGFLNRLISQYTGFETDVIKTGNAGEHALSMELAMELEYTSGFSIETYHFMNLLEQFGGILAPAQASDIMKNGVCLYQIESRNPHLHDLKEEGHVPSMIEKSLSVIYHSDTCPDVLREEIMEELIHLEIVAPDGQPLRPRKYPALQTLKTKKLRQVFDPGKFGNY